MIVIERYCKAGLGSSSTDWWGFWFWWDRWWFRNPANQLRLVVYLHILQGFIHPRIPGGCLGFLPSTVLSESFACCCTRYRRRAFMLLTPWCLNLYGIVCHPCIFLHHIASYYYYYIHILAERSVCVGFVLILLVLWMWGLCSLLHLLDLHSAIFPAWQSIASTVSSCVVPNGISSSLQPQGYAQRRELEYPPPKESYHIWCGKFLHISKSQNPACYIHGMSWMYPPPPNSNKRRCTEIS